jgi:hypothetical protein
LGGFLLYQWAKPYLNAVKNLGGVAGDVRGFTHSASSTLNSISNVFSDISHISSGVSSLYDDMN